MSYASHPEVLLDLDGGPGGRHPEGWSALAGLAERPPAAAAAGETMAAARCAIGDTVGLPSEAVVLTSGGAEADNAAVKGLALAALARGGRPGRVLISAAEHAPVRDACRRLEILGFEVREVAVSAGGRVDEAAFLAALAERPVLAALQWANNELGTVQPLARVAAAAAAAGVPLHVDASAAAPWLDLARRPPGCASLSISCRELGGPPGIGALLLAPGIPWVPLLDGGGDLQEGRRAGSLLPELASALAASLAAAVRHHGRRGGRARSFRDGLETELTAALPDAEILAGGVERLPGHLALVVDGAGGEAMARDLGAAGIRVGTGARCGEGPGVPSRILRAAGLPARRAAATLLLRAGADLEPAAARRVAAAVASAAGRLREMAP